MRKILHSKKQKLKLFLGQTRVWSKRIKERSCSVKACIQTHHQENQEKGKEEEKA
jgi:hypothetical protein